MVEHLLPKQRVDGSSPFSRSGYNGATASVAIPRLVLLRVKQRRLGHRAQGGRPSGGGLFLFSVFPGVQATAASAGVQVQ